MDDTPIPTLKSCPFCGAGDTQIKDGSRVWSGMKYGEPSSVSVVHWCPATPGQPSRMIERIGRDRASAIEAWNRRAAAALVEVEAANPPIGSVHSELRSGPDAAA